MSRPAPVPDGYTTVTPWIIVMSRMPTRWSSVPWRPAPRLVTQVTPLPFGDQVGRFVDPWGNTWWVQERLEVVSPEEMGQRMADPRYAEAMRYLQETLAEEMRQRGPEGQTR